MTATTPRVPPRTPRPLLLAVVATLAVLLAACTSGGADTKDEIDPSSGSTQQPGAAEASGCNADTPGPEPAAVQALPGDDDDSSVMLTLLQTGMGEMGKGAAGEVGGQLAGYALSAIGVSSDNNPQLTEIANELETINTTLTNINACLNQIDSDINYQTCATDADSLNTTLGNIDNFYTKMNTYSLLPASEGKAPEESDLETWTDNVLDQDSGAMWNMQQLYDAAAKNLSSGAMYDCIKANGQNNLPALGTLDDRPYYQDVVLPVQLWFYGYAMETATVVTEAHHYKAWLEAGQPQVPSRSASPSATPTGDADVVNDLTDICQGTSPSGSPSSSPSGSPTSSPTGGDPTVQCAYAGSDYDQVIDWLTDALQIGGAPYSTDEYVIANGYQDDQDANFLLVTSLEDYTSAAGATCASPLPSGTLCGPLSRGPTASIPSIKYGNYGSGSSSGDPGTWTSATAGQFSLLLNHGFSGLSNDSTTPAGWLCTHAAGSTTTTGCQSETPYEFTGQGLENADKVITFSENYRTKLGTDADSVAVYCFYDGKITRGHTSGTLCSGSDTDLQQFWTYHSGKSGSCPTAKTNFERKGWYSTSSFASSDSNVTHPPYYYGRVCYYTGVLSDDSYLGWGNDPSGNAGPPDYATDSTTATYHWPALTWSNLQCTNSNGASVSASNFVNPGGVPTMCGDDFKRWLDAMLPPLQ